MRHAFVVLVLVLSLFAGGCSVSKNPPVQLIHQPTSGNTQGPNWVTWAKGAQGTNKQEYEVRNLTIINGYPSTYWAAGSWSGTPPPGMSGFMFNPGYNPGYHYPGYYPRFGW